MNIANFGSLPQLWKWIVGWLGGLTLAGLAATVNWIWNIRKLNVEIANIKKQTAELVHKEDVREAALAILRNANILATETNNLSLLRSEWASHLKKPLLIDEALIEAGAEREPGKEDRWLLRLAPQKQADRFTPRRLG